MIGDEVVIYDPVRHLAHLLNPTAAAVWHALDGARTLPEVRDLLVARYHAPAATVGADVEALATRLSTQGLLGDGPSAPGPPDAASTMASSHCLVPLGAVATDEPTDPPPLRTATFRALHLQFAVAADDPVLIATLDEILAPLAVAGRPSLLYTVRSAGEGVTVALADIQPIAVAHLGAAADRILWDYNHRAITTARGRTLLHASAVRTAAGVVAFPAPANAGKSTLVAALARRGYSYVTDECVAVPAGTTNVEAYPKPIGLDPGSWPLFPDATPAPLPLARRWVRGDRRGGVDEAGPTDVAPLLALVFPTYTPGADPDGLTRLRPAEVLVRLARNTFGLAADPSAGIAALADLADRIPGYDLPVDDLDQAGQEIDRLLA